MIWVEGRGVGNSWPFEHLGSTILQVGHCSVMRVFSVPTWWSFTGDTSVAWDQMPLPIYQAENLKKTFLLVYQYNLQVFPLNPGNKKFWKAWHEMCPSEVITAFRCLIFPPHHTMELSLHIYLSPLLLVLWSVLHIVSGHYYDIIHASAVPCKIMDNCFLICCVDPHPVKSPLKSDFKHSIYLYFSSLESLGPQIKMSNERTVTIRGWNGIQAKPCSSLPPTASAGKLFRLSVCPSATPQSQQAPAPGFCFLNGGGSTCHLPAEGDTFWSDSALFGRG